jgi:hypothetical protein
MFTLNNFIYDIKSIPSDWIFENYLQLPEQLTGQRVRMQSLFNLEDKTPSMYLHFQNGIYKYKCFSSGNSGKAVNLMMHIWKVDFAQAAKKITEDYKEYLKTGITLEKKQFIDTKWIVTEFEERKWTVNDANFWLQFNIGSDLLKRYNVIPIESYTMCKYQNDEPVGEKFTISNNYIYAYLNASKVPYKIYQPKKSEKKFLKLLQHIQGYDQLEGKRFLVITSSLKDCMSIKSIPGLDIDVIAPDSENSKLSCEVIEHLKTKYEAIVTYMDNDKAGIESMKYYLDKYQLPFCYVTLEKDFSDTVKVHGIKKAAYTFIPILDKAIQKYYDLNKKI